MCLVDSTLITLCQRVISKFEYIDVNFILMLHWTGGGVNICYDMTFHFSNGNVFSKFMYFDIKSRYFFFSFLRCNCFHCLENYLF